MLIAIDTNVLLDLALGVEAVQDAFRTIRERITVARLVAPPTVLQELAFAVKSGVSAKREAALCALSRLREWDIEPLNLVPVGHGIVERIAGTLRREGLIPDEEENDSLIAAESALLGCGMLLTADRHLRDMDFQRFTVTIQSFDLAAPVIATPREIVRKFFR